MEKVCVYDTRHKAFKFKIDGVVTKIISRDMVMDSIERHVKPIIKGIKCR